MPVVALASSKGGCGKSTTALILASAIVAAGYKVRIIDADRSARLAKWDYPAATVVEYCSAVLTGGSARTFTRARTMSTISAKWRH